MACQLGGKSDNRLLLVNQPGCSLNGVGTPGRDNATGNRQRRFRLRLPSLPQGDQAREIARTPP